MKASGQGTDKIRGLALQRWYPSNGDLRQHLYFPRCRQEDISFFHSPGTGWTCSHHEVVQLGVHEKVTEQYSSSLCSGASHISKKAVDVTRIQVITA
jgi:hypothetical protein